MIKMNDKNAVYRITFIKAIIYNSIMIKCSLRVYSKFMKRNNSFIYQTLKYDNEFIENEISKMVKSSDKQLGEYIREKKEEIINRLKYGTEQVEIKYENNENVIYKIKDNMCFVYDNEDNRWIHKIRHCTNYCVEKMEITDIKYRNEKDVFEIERSRVGSYRDVIYEKVCLLYTNESKVCVICPECEIGWGEKELFKNFMYYYLHNCEKTDEYDKFIDQTKAELIKKEILNNGINFINLKIIKKYLISVLYELEIEGIKGKYIYLKASDYNRNSSLDEKKQYMLKSRFSIELKDEGCQEYKKIKSKISNENIPKYFEDYYGKTFMHIGLFNYLKPTTKKNSTEITKIKNWGEIEINCAISNFDGKKDLKEFIKDTIINNLGLEGKNISTHSDYEILRKEKYKCKIDIKTDEFSKALLKNNLDLNKMIKEIIEEMRKEAVEDIKYLNKFEKKDEIKKLLQLITISTSKKKIDDEDEKNIRELIDRYFVNKLIAKI